MAQALIDQLQSSLASLSSCLCAPTAQLKLNGQTYRIVKLLGEGGFSYVYLVENVSAGRLLAVKKIRCPIGGEGVREAMKEIEAYKRFRHPNIIRCLDSCVVQDRDGEGKIIYLFLPYYPRGTLQDLISTNALSGSSIPERELLQIFLGVCHAVRAMHTYRPGSNSPTPTAAAYPPTGAAMGAGSSEMVLPRPESHADDEEETGEGGEREGLMRGGGYAGVRSGEGEGDDEDVQVVHEDNAGDSRLAGVGDEDGKRVEGRLPARGLAIEAAEGVAPTLTGGIQPWAHRDIKPANIMLSASTPPTPILFDFGSTLPSPIPIPTRSAALTQQDLASEHCSMPYRAPELFEVPVGPPLDEKVDIWSLGCTLYAAAYGGSPFEIEGNSISLAVQGGRYRFPQRDPYGEGLKGVVKACLVVKPNERPDIHKVIELTQAALAGLS